MLFYCSAIKHHHVFTNTYNNMKIHKFKAKKFKPKVFPFTKDFKKTLSKLAFTQLKALYQ